MFFFSCNWLTNGMLSATAAIVRARGDAAGGEPCDISSIVRGELIEGGVMLGTPRARVGGEGVGVSDRGTAPREEERERSSERERAWERERLGGREPLRLVVGADATRGETGSEIELDAGRTVIVRVVPMSETKGWGGTTREGEGGGEKTFGLEGMLGKGDMKA
jgi:hypothetical protein